MKFPVACLTFAFALNTATAAETELPVRPAEPVPVAPAIAVEPGETPPPAATPTLAETGDPTPEPTPKLTKREMINVLSETQVEQAIISLRTNFLDPTKTGDKEVRRATLEGLVLRLSPGALITNEADIRDNSSAGLFLAEIIDDRIGYLRLGDLKSESLPQVDAALGNFSEKKLKALILDLRNVAPSRDFEVAAEFARRFCEKGKLLFSIQKPSAKQERIFTSNLDPLFSGVLVVLTDGDTSGAAEALAGTLRLNANAMIVGANTSGEAVEFEDTPLGDGKILRVAVAQVVLPNAGAIYPNGVVPDIAASLSADDQAEIFRLSAERGVSQFVFESERPRMNEAALVANTNPELDAEVFRERNASPKLKDTVLQRAVDLVTAIRFYGERAQ